MAHLKMGLGWGKTVRMWLALFCALVVTSDAANAEPLTNDNVVGLASAGLGDDVLIAKIKTSEPMFDVSTPALLALKQKGVSSGVIAAMIDRSSARDLATQSPESADPLVAHPIGLYLLDDTISPPKMVRIDASGSSQMKIGNTLGYAFSYGIAPITMKVSINGERAHIVSKNRIPVFYIFAAQSQNGATPFNPYTMMGNLAFFSLASPNDFSLIRLTSKSGHREAKVGNFNIAGAQTGVMDKDRVQFQYVRVRDGVFKVTASAPIEPGEYAFVKGMASASSVFDFSVQ